MYVKDITLSFYIFRFCHVLITVIASLGHHLKTNYPLVDELPHRAPVKFNYEPDQDAYQGKYFFIVSNIYTFFKYIFF